MSDKIQRIEYEADPNRCQGMTGKGQCMCKAMEGGKFCPIHAGAGKIKIKEEKHKNYLLVKWQARIEEKKQSPDLKNLRDEIGILRMLMEERLNQCESSADLMLHSTALSDLAIKIEKMVGSCQKLEEKLGNVLDKQSILNFASKIIAVLGTELEGQDELLERISNKILVAIGELGNENTEYQD